MRGDRLVELHPLLRVVHRHRDRRVAHPGELRRQRHRGVVGDRGATRRCGHRADRRAPPASRRARAGRRGGSRPCVGTGSIVGSVEAERARDRRACARPRGPTAAPGPSSTSGFSPRERPRAHPTRRARVRTRVDRVTVTRLLERHRARCRRGRSRRRSSSSPSRRAASAAISVDRYGPGNATRPISSSTTTASTSPSPSPPARSSHEQRRSSRASTTACQSAAVETVARVGPRAPSRP